MHAQSKKQESTYDGCRPDLQAPHVERDVDVAEPVAYGCLAMFILVVRAVLVELLEFVNDAAMEPLLVRKTAELRNLNSK